MTNKSLTPLKAIKEHCKLCNGDDHPKRCNATDCHLHPYRLGKRPSKNQFLDENAREKMRKNAMINFSKGRCSDGDE